MSNAEIKISRIKIPSDYSGIFNSVNLDYASLELAYKQSMVQTIYQRLKYQNTKQILQCTINLY